VPLLAAPAAPPPPAGLPAPLRALRRTAVMGILNVTPDSFSDGGRYHDVPAAVAHAEQMVAEGADLIDVGGESTRPGARRVAPGEEADRVLPVVAAVASLGVPVSVDTMRASIARAAVANGAVLVNDVSGGRADPAMLGAVAELRVPVVLMHWRGHSDTMAERAQYRDVVGEVAEALGERVAAARAAGVAADKIVVDPGLGFAKEADHNWALLAHLDGAVPAGLPVLVGASRKRFLGALLADPAGGPRPADRRDAASAAVTALAAGSGAWCVRVHNVAASADAVRVAAAWRAAAGATGPAHPGEGQP
jgi:dihydropteroate synthase